MSNKILVIYNTCALYEKEAKAEAWIDQLKSILTQDIINDCKVVHSDCGTHPKYRPKIKEYFENDISYYHTPEALPIQATCNHAAKKMVEAYGEFETYLYLGAGITFAHNSQLEVAYKILTANSNKLSKLDFHVSRPPELPPAEELHPPFDFYNYLETSNDHYYALRPGQRVNNHTAMFTNLHFKSYGDRLLPDAYNGNGAESIYPYLASALNRQHGVLSFKHGGSLFHEPDHDGANQFLPLTSGEQRRSYFYNWAFRNEEGHLEELNEKGLEFGLQTDVPNNEMCQRQMPRKEFNQDGLPMDEKHKQALLDLLLEYVFLDESKLNYEEIENMFTK